MPELPEVETIARGLQEVLVGRKIKEVKAFFPGIVRQNFSLFRKGVKGGRIEGVKRRGKYLLMDLSMGRTILIHLGMTGSLLWMRPDKRSSEPRGAHEERKAKHDHLIFKFHGTDFELRYNDQRKFGRIKIFDTVEEETIPELKRLGPESNGIPFSEFARIFKKRKAGIKSLLLNQRVIAGLGNIYADESLFEAKIHPVRRADTLTKTELKRLHQAIGKILNRAIKAGGSSVENYRDINGELGSFQLQHKVYGREGLSCRRCKTEIKRIKINQRSSYFCPRCQPMKKR